MNPYEFEQRLKAYIKQSGRSQASVARAIGYSRDIFNAMFTLKGNKMW